MNVSELYSLTNWVEKEIVERSVSQKYQALYSILQQHVESSMPKQSFGMQRDELIKTLLEVPLDKLSKDQLNYLFELDIAQAVGQQGVAILEDTLYKNVIDVMTSSETVKNIFHNLNNGIERACQIKQGMGSIQYEKQLLREDEVLMRVSFSGQSALSNVVDFRHWGSIWYDIGYGVALSHGEKPEDIKIVGATNSPVALELAVSYNIANTTSHIILAVLKVADKVMSITQKAEELRMLKLKNDKLVMDLEKEAEYENKIGVETISSDIIKRLGLKKNGEGDKIIALIKTVKHLVYFIGNGGEVDFVFQQNENSEQHYKDLPEVFQKIRVLEEKLIHSKNIIDNTEAEQTYLNAAGKTPNPVGASL